MSSGLISMGEVFSTGLTNGILDTVGSTGGGNAESIFALQLA